MSLLKSLKYSGLFGVIMPVMFGLIIAYLLTPILNCIEQKILNPLFNKLKIKTVSSPLKSFVTCGITRFFNSWLSSIRLFNHVERFTTLGTPYAALVSVIVGVTNVIPFFGPYLGAIPCAFLILIVDLTHPMNCVTFVGLLACQDIYGYNKTNDKVPCHF